MVMQDVPKAHSRRSPGLPVPPGPVPTAGRLRDAALAHLARFAATEAGLVRVLDRRIQRWAARAAQAGNAPDQVAAQAATARQAARTVASGLVASGVIDDTAYAESKARSLTRSGRSRRAIEAHLAGRGVASELVEAALPDDREAELGAAVLQARRRRIGPFGDSEAMEDPLARNKALAALARGGFARDVAERALRLDRETADQVILELKRR